MVYPMFRPKRSPASGTTVANAWPGLSTSAKQCQPWVQWVDFLFGEQPAFRPSGTVSSWAPRPAALAIRSAHLDPSLRDALRSLDPVRREKLLQSFTFLKPGVAINPGSRHLGSFDKHLRFIEMARADASFVSSISLGDLDDEERLKDAAALLLRPGQALIKRLGGKRRRGSGKCRLKWRSRVICHSEGRTKPQHGFPSDPAPCRFQNRGHPRASRPRRHPQAPHHLPEHRAAPGTEYPA